MKIISKVEINYFRSIYSINLLRNNDVNVLIGGNDSGKSNILKALNLFFNNETELNTPFNFIEDLSRLREKEARSAKGRASIWIKVTFNNFLGWKSLPDQFSIKRTWNRYEEYPVDTYSEDLPSTTIGRFLNRLSFHYIPAVRGRDIFSHYLNALHDALIDDEKAGFRGASVNLLDAINSSTRDMSDKINKGLNIQSSIQVPEDLRELFSALDFSTKFSGYDIPLQKRGDGIQARHIPFILDFVARHSSKQHIWAYEEPENSLELSKAFELASEFSTDFSKENQIFLTTHSPAFYDLSGPNVSKWLVKPEDFYSTGNELHTNVTEILSGQEVDESLGIAALIATRAKELYVRINDLNKAQQQLEDKIASVAKAQVIVEGPSDKRILEIAFAKLFPNDECFCEFISAEGADNLTHNLKSFKTIEKKYPFPIIGLFDNDQKGRAESKHFNMHKLVANDQFREISAEKKIYSGMLPIVPALEKVADECKMKSGFVFQIPLTIEFMFPQDVIKKAIEAQELVLNETKYTAKHTSGIQYPVNLTEECKKHLPEDYHYLAYEIDESYKVRFSEWVLTLEAEAFFQFKPLLENLKFLCD